MNTNPVQFHILLDPELRRAIKRLCAELDLSMSQWGRRVLKAAVERDGKTADRERVSEGCDGIS